MGSVHGKRGLEVVEMARGGDTLIQRGVDCPFPTHDIPSRVSQSPGGPLPAGSWGYA
jgi:hypothetical protein